mmetsp:Transcript_3889/g.6850  ORF Transcript_3889/g.6850 Transcript_3889/m.6850 type:complete len:316 (+) Transcript_3889:158-1105(+)
MAIEGLSAGEAAALAGLKAEIAAVGDGDPKYEWMLATDSVVQMRFLRGHKLSVPKAFKLLKQCSAWRHEYGTNDILTTWPQDQSQEAILLRSKWPLGITGQDFSGRPVHFFHLAMTDFPKLLQHVSITTIVRYNVYLMEKALTKNPKGEAIMLLDLGHGADGKSAFSLLTAARWLTSLLVFVKAMAKIADPYYPESYFRIYFCRLNRVLESMFHKVSSSMNDSTLSKVQLLSKSDVLEKLLEDMPIESIPRSLGGTSIADIATGGIVKDADVSAASEEAAEKAGGSQPEARKSSRITSLRKSIAKRLSLSGTQEE